MSCFNNPGATHHAGCACWEERVRKEVWNEAIEVAAKVADDIDDKLPTASCIPDFIRDLKKK